MHQAGGLATGAEGGWEDPGEGRSTQGAELFHGQTRPRLQGGFWGLRQYRL